MRQLKFKPLDQFLFGDGRSALYVGCRILVSRDGLHLDDHLHRQGEWERRRDISVYDYLEILAAEGYSYFCSAAMDAWATARD